MGAEAVHMPVRGRNPPITHYDGDLVQGFRQAAPKVPVVGWAAHVGARVTFNGMVEVREFQWIAEEENRSVVTDQVPVALFGIKTQRKTANVPLRIGCTTFAGDRRKAYKHVGLFADFAEQGRLGVLRDVMGNGETTERARTFSVHAPLGDNLTVKMRHLLQKPRVLKQDRTARTGGQAVLIVCYRAARHRR